MRPGDMRGLLCGRAELYSRRQSSISTFASSSVRKVSRLNSSSRSFPLSVEPGPREGVSRKEQPILTGTGQWPPVLACVAGGELVYRDFLRRPNGLEGLAVSRSDTPLGLGPRLRLLVVASLGTRPKRPAGPFAGARPATTPERRSQRGSTHCQRGCRPP